MCQLNLEDTPLLDWLDIGRGSDTQCGDRAIITMTAKAAKITLLTTIASSVAKKVFQNEFIGYL